MQFARPVVEVVAPDKFEILVAVPECVRIHRVEIDVVSLVAEAAEVGDRVVN
jgi:hypothetical protein